MSITTPSCLNGRSYRHQFEHEKLRRGGENTGLIEPGYTSPQVEQPDKRNETIYFLRFRFSTLPISFSYLGRHSLICVSRADSFSDCVSLSR